MATQNKKENTHTPRRVQIHAHIQTTHTLTPLLLMWAQANWAHCVRDTSLCVRRRRRRRRFTRATAVAAVYVEVAWLGTTGDTTATQLTPYRRAHPEMITGADRAKCEFDFSAAATLSCSLWLSRCQVREQFSAQLSRSFTTRLCK